eukprot:scaffold1499_cov318-Pavlova_lutheri.AAC.2
MLLVLTALLGVFILCDPSSFTALLRERWQLRKFSLEVRRAALSAATCCGRDNSLPCRSSIEEVERADSETTPLGSVPPFFSSLVCSESTATSRLVLVPVLLSLTVCPTSFDRPVQPAFSFSTSMATFPRPPIHSCVHDRPASPSVFQRDARGSGARSCFVRGNSAPGVLDGGQTRGLFQSKGKGLKGEKGNGDPVHGRTFSSAGDGP